MGCVKYCLIAWMFKTIHSTTVLVPTGTAAQCRRREPPVLNARRSGGEWDVCHCTKFYRAATEQGFVEVAARLSLVVWGAYYSPLALEAIVTGVGAATRGLRFWLSTATAPPFKTMASKLPHERLNQAPNFDYLICKVLFKPIHSTSVLVPIGTAHPLPVPSGTGASSAGAGGEWDVCNCTEFHRAATGPSIIEVAARWSLVGWHTSYSPPTHRHQQPVPEGTG